MDRMPDAYFGLLMLGAMMSTQRKPESVPTVGHSTGECIPPVSRKYDYPQDKDLWARDVTKIKKRRKRR